MRRIARIASLLLALFGASQAFAQVTLLQGGPFTQGRAPMYVGGGGSQPVVQDSGPAGGGLPGVGLSELGITSRATASVTSAPYANSGSGPYFTHSCMYDAPTNNASGYHYFCLDPNAQGGGLMAFGAGGGASSLPLQFIVNGSTYAFPFTVGGITGPVSSTIGHVAVWNNTTGTLLADGGALNFSNIGGTLGCSQLPTFTGDVTNSSCAMTIGAGVVTASKMAAGAAASNVGTLGGDLAGSTLLNPTIAAGVVTGSKIAATTITASNVATNTLTYSQMAQSAANTVGGNPTGSTANRQDMAMPSCSGAQQFLQWLSGSGFQCGSLSVSTPTSPVRQTVMGGPVQSSPNPGWPNLFPATSVSLSLTTQNVTSSYPLVITAANGFGSSGPVDVVGTSTSNITWSGLGASSTLYLYVTVSGGTLSTGFTALAPIYEYGGTPSTTNGQFTFNIGEMRGYMGNGSTATQANIVFVGQVTTNGSGVTAAIAYAYNGQSQQPLTGLGYINGIINVTHNLGVAPGEAKLYLVNVSTDNGWGPGSVMIGGQTTTNSAGIGPWGNTVGTTNFQWSMTSGGIIGMAASNGAAFTLTAANWDYYWVFKRGWGGA